MIVGDAPGDKDFGSPFVATSWVLDPCLVEAGLHREMAFLTTVARESAQGKLGTSVWVAGSIKARTLDHREINGKWVLPPLAAGRSLLHQEIALCKPTVVVAMGDAALWALDARRISPMGLTKAANWGTRKWRSSILQGEIDGHKFKVIPTLHPSSIMREWATRGLLVHDLRRAHTEMGRGGVVTVPDYRFIIRPTYDQAISTLTDLLHRLQTATEPIPLAADIETRAGHTACVGIAWSRLEAICVPWMCTERDTGYWTLEQETELIILFNQIFTHPKASLTWQNGAYDHQYEHRHHFIQPNLGWDTMLAHHAMFSISPKGLDHLSSLYCDYHAYWKDDGKLWDPTIDEDEFWFYNCEDCVRTFEIREVETQAISYLASSGWPKLPSVVEFQHAIQPAVVRMMFRGVRSDDKSRRNMAVSLMQACTRIQSEIDELAGQSLNIRSPLQMTEFFYGTLNQSPIYSRKPDGTRGGLTCDDDALLTISRREPVLRPLIARIQSLRSGGVFKSTFVDMARDTDGRLRCSYNVAGTKTYRFNSSKNAFNSGGNLQNVPEGDDEDLDALILLPNIRKLFLFDEGCTGFDLDGDSADLRVVTGESGCRAMQDYFAAGVKPYIEIAKEFYQDPTITKSHYSYKLMKALCHGSNYGGEGPGLAFNIGLLVHEVDKMQKWYFGMCPEIKAWQEDTKHQFESRGYIEGPWGHRLWRWDRYSKKLGNEALAWKPQSTVGLLINKALLAIDQTLPTVQLLLQVHDSLTGQYPTHLGPGQQALIKAAATIPIPCTTGPVIVPMGLKTSTVSWGDCA